MQVTLNLQTASKINNIKKQSAKPKAADSVAFCGLQNDNTNSLYAYTIDFAPILKGARHQFKHVLTSDGFNSAQISKWRIFSHPEMGDDFTFNELLKKSEHLPSKVASIEVFPNPKNLFDIKAMEQVYRALSSSFCDEDIKRYNDIFSKAAKLLKEPPKFEQEKFLKEIILQILAYTNDNNKELALELIKDPDFNNANLAQALAGIRTKEDTKAALEALKAAREIGYCKDFSFVLAIMLSEATKDNLPVVKKALTEQEFLTSSNTFVTNKLFNFLRQKDYLTVSYVKDPSMTLKDVEEIIDSVKGYS